MLKNLTQKILRLVLPSGFLANNIRKIRGNNNVIRSENSKLSSVIFDIKGNDNQIDIQEGAVLKNVTFHIRGDKHKILIGKYCSFNRGGNIWLEDAECTLSIGARSTFEDVHLAVTEPGSQMHIGCNCMFASDIDIRTGDSHSIISQKSNERINHAKDIFIDDHVWIGAHSILLKGSYIAENSVVATGAVVTRRFETPGIIIGGNPARQLKEGITWTRER